MNTEADLEIAEMTSFWSLMLAGSCREEKTGQLEVEGRR